MGEYANIKLNKLLRFIDFLSKHKDITIRCKGRHQLLIKYIFTNRPFPIPCHSGDINKFIVKDLVEKAVSEWKVCTQEEVDRFLK